MDVLVLVVDDEPDVEALFRQQFRRDLRSQRFMMDFANSASDALKRGLSAFPASGDQGRQLVALAKDLGLPTEGAEQ